MAQPKTDSAGQNIRPVKTRPEPNALVSMGSGILTVSSTAVGFASGDITPTQGGAIAVKAICHVESADIRYRTATNPPKAGVAGGIPVLNGEIIEITGAADILEARFIRDASTNVTMNYTLFREA